MTDLAQQRVRCGEKYSGTALPCVIKSFSKPHEICLWLFGTAKMK